MNQVRYGQVVGRLHIVIEQDGETIALGTPGQPFQGLGQAQSAVHRAIAAAAAEDPRNPQTGRSWAGYLVLKEDNRHQADWCAKHGYELEWFLGEEVVLCRGRIDPDMARPCVESLVSKRYACYMQYHFPAWLSDHGPDNWPHAVLDWSRGTSHWATTFRLSWIDLRTGQAMARQVDITTPTF